MEQGGATSVRQQAQRGRYGRKSQAQAVFSDRRGRHFDQRRRLYAIQPTPGTLLGFRLFGAALLTFGLILFLLRDSREWTALRGLLIGASVGNIAGIIVSAWATVAGVMNGAGWLFVATYGVLLLGYAYSLWALSRKHAH
jgi:hypothetical protein